MGNCQAVDVAALVIQHPSGRIDRMYWSVSASEVMKMNPGHCITLIIPLPNSGEENSDEKTVQFTRVKLLRPTDTLLLGRSYRLVTSQEVIKVLRAKKYAKMKKNRQESGGESPTDSETTKTSSCKEDAGKSQVEKNNQENSSSLQPAMRHERHQQKPSGSTNIDAARSKNHGALPYEVSLRLEPNCVSHCNFQKRKWTS